MPEKIKVTAAEHKAVMSIAATVGVDVNADTDVADRAYRMILAWVRAEGGLTNKSNNPLGTTLTGQPGDTGPLPGNPHGVRTFDTVEHGGQAAGRTLLGSFHEGLLDALKRGDVSGFARQLAGAQPKWGTSSVLWSGTYNTVDEGTIVVPVGVDVDLPGGLITTPGELKEGVAGAVGGTFGWVAELTSKVLDWIRDQVERLLKIILGAATVGAAVFIAFREGLGVAGKPVAILLLFIGATLVWSGIRDAGVVNTAKGFIGA